MEPLQLPASKDNPADSSADQTGATPLNRAAFATAVAQSEFRSAYVPPIDADFIDRTPAELEAIRLSMELGAAR